MQRFHFIHKCCYTLFTLSLLINCSATWGWVDHQGLSDVWWISLEGNDLTPDLFCILYGFRVYKDELRKKLNSLFSELKTSGAKMATNIFCAVVNMSFNLVSHQPSMKLYLVRFGQCKIVFRLIHTRFESNIIHHCSVKQNQLLFTEVTHAKFVSRLLT